MDSPVTIQEVPPVADEIRGGNDKLILTSIPLLLSMETRYQQAVLSLSVIRGLETCPFPSLCAPSCAVSALSSIYVDLRELAPWQEEEGSLRASCDFAFASPE